MGETPELKSYEYKIGDLVWAKLKTFCPWPAKVVEAPTNIPKPKKGAYKCVLFFGANNYAYIELHNLKPYKEYKDTLVGASKTASFKDAVAQIEKYIEDKEKYGDDFDAIQNDQDAEFNKLRDAQSPVLTPKEKVKKAKKESPLKKRASESGGSSVGRPPKKSKLSSSFSTPTNDDGLLSSTPTGSEQNHVNRKRFQSVLDRPSMFLRPESPPLDVDGISKNISDRDIKPSTLTFGFLGTGNIGGQIVKNLKISGHKVVAWNRTPDKLKPLEELGVKTLQTPQDVVQHADVTFCCVSDPNASKMIVFGNCGVLKANLANKGYVELSGIDHETSQDIADAITAAGGRYLEAQMLGNREQAKHGTFLLMAAGDNSLFDDCQSCFRVIGKHSYHLKDVGNACKMNIIYNLISGITIAGLAEGLALADRAGLQLTDVELILKQTRLASPDIMENCSNIINNPYSKNFPLKHMQKYLKLALNMADPMEQALPLTASSNEVYKHTKRLGYADYDVSSCYCAFGALKLPSNYLQHSNKRGTNILMFDHQEKSETDFEKSIGNNSMEMNSVERQQDSETEKLQDKVNSIEDTTSTLDSSGTIAANDVKDGAHAQEGAVDQPQNGSGDAISTKNELNNCVEQNSQELIEAKN